MRTVRKLRYKRVIVFLIIVGVVLMSFVNASIAISKVVKIEKFEPISKEEVIIEYIPNKTKLINITKNVYEDVEVLFDINQSINLELSSSDDIYIKALNKSSGESIIEKNNTWDKYLLDTENYKVKNGIINPGTYKVRFTKSELNNIDANNINIDFFIKKDGKEIYYHQENGL